MRSEAEVVVQEHGPLVVCAVMGEIDIAAVPELEAAMARIDLGGVSTLEVDLTAVTFADSSALAWLLRLQERVAAADATMVVVLRPGPVRDILAITRIDHRLTVLVDGPSTRVDLGRDSP